MVATMGYYVSFLSLLLKAQLMGNIGSCAGGTCSWMGGKSEFIELIDDTGRPLKPS